MGALFSPDSRFMRVMNLLADLMILNLLFLLTSLPLVTIGASSAAMYTLCFRMGTEREGRLVRGYFRAFGAEFKKSAILWIVMLLFLGGSAASSALFSRMGGALQLAAIPCAILFFLALLMCGYVFPLQCRFENSPGATLKNAMLLSVAHLPRSLLIAAINALPVFLLLFDPLFFLQAGFLWVSLYFSVGAYITSRLLGKVFAPYLTEEDQT